MKRDFKNEHMRRFVIEKTTLYLILLNPFALNVGFASYAVLAANHIKIHPPVLLVFIVGCYYALLFYKAHGTMLLLEMNNKRDSEDFFRAAQKVVDSIESVLVVAGIGFIAVICDLAYAVSR